MCFSVWCDRTWCGVSGVVRCVVVRCGFVWLAWRYVYGVVWYDIVYAAS